MKTIIAFAAAALISGAAGAANFENGDSYGSVLFDDVASSSHAVQPGVGDAYGSVLFDTVAGDTGEPQKGENDAYGSILNDI